MIRELEEKDFIKVNELLKDFNYELNKESFENDFLKTLVYEDGFIKGVLVYQYIYNRAEIDYIIVDNNYRKLGIATKLLKYLEDSYKLDNITLEVR